MRLLPRKLFFGLGAIAFLFLILLARFPLVTFVSPDQHDVIAISNLATLQHFYGTLTNAPHLYTFHVEEPTDISLALFVPNLREQKNDVSILVLRKKDRGLDLVTRLEASRASWVRTTWWETGDSYRKGGGWHDMVTPGTYEVEVSTPSNIGSYVLAVGTESTSTLLSYTTELRNVFRIKQFFHTSSIAALESPLLYIPLVLLTSIVIRRFRTYRARRGMLY